MIVPAPPLEFTGKSLTVNVPELIFILAPSGAVILAEELLSNEISFAPFVEITSPAIRST